LLGFFLDKRRALREDFTINILTEGVVYKAEDPAGNILALKTLRPDRGATEEFRQRFKREVETVQQLKHPNILPIREVGEADVYPFFTMEFIAQGNLGEHRSRFLGDPMAAARLVEQIARGMQYAHDEGFLHSDLNPGNILLAENGRPLISDFGLAKTLGDDGDLTRTGQLLGTLPYMSPEQALGRVRSVGTHSDLWALGVILYELLAGERPFCAEDDVELIEQIEADVPIRPNALRPEIPPALNEIVFKCLQKDPDDRYEKVGDLADDLARWQAGLPPELGRRSWPRQAWRRMVRHPRIAAVLTFIPNVFGANKKKNCPTEKPSN
jgi:serine/threonine-protein kinase